MLLQSYYESYRSNISNFFSPKILKFGKTYGKINGKIPRKSAYFGIF
jgi:hypothetical protein